MYEVKVNLIMALPGRTLMSEQECSRKTRKPLVKNGKQVYNKKHEEVWVNTVEADPEKTHVERLDLVDEDTGEVTTIITRLRNARPAKRILNISQEAYEDFIDRENVPYDFNPGVKNADIRRATWKAMSNISRLEWHLRDMCKALGGTLSSYAVLE